jgi:hypothetical protein
MEASRGTAVLACCLILACARAVASARPSFAGRQIVIWKDIIMSASLHPTEIHRRRHRRAKRNKLRAQLATAPAVGRPAIEAKLQKTYPVGSGPQPVKSP